MDRVYLVSLGCPKNRVDSEVMVGKLQEGAWEMATEPDDADVIVVNTCSFIQPATEESIETVLEMAKFKEEGRCKKLIVTGCMVQRYGASLEGEFPEVDVMLACQCCDSLRHSQSMLVYELSASQGIESVW